MIYFLLGFRSSSSFSHVSNDFEITRRTDPVESFDNTYKKSSFKSMEIPEITRRTEPIEKDDKLYGIPEISRREESDPIVDGAFKANWRSGLETTQNTKLKHSLSPVMEGSWRS